jgi:hypothetical protein
MLSLSASTAVTGALFVTLLVIWREQSRSERDRHPDEVRVAPQRHAAVGPRMAPCRAVESRPVMAAGTMTQECVGRKSI